VSAVRWAGGRVTLRYPGAVAPDATSPGSRLAVLVSWRGTVVPGSLASSTAAYSPVSCENTIRQIAYLACVASALAMVAAARRMTRYKCWMHSEVSSGSGLRG
jgi:hypothetical protein